MGRFLCGSILSHCEGVVMLSVGEVFLCVLGNYNGNVGSGKNGKLDEDWCRSTRRDKLQRAAKMAGVDGH